MASEGGALDISGRRSLPDFPAGKGAGHLLPVPFGRMGGVTL